MAKTMERGGANRPTRIDEGGVLKECNVEALFPSLPGDRSHAPPDDCPYPACYAEGAASIAQAKREWECTADALPQLVCLLDQHGRIVRANRTTESWGLGLVSEVAGLGVHELLHPGCEDDSCYLSRFCADLIEVVDGGHTARCEEDDTILKRFLEIQARPTLEEDAGQLGHHGTVVVVHDITERKWIEEALRMFNSGLEQRVQARTEQLETANRRLRREILDRRKAQEALQASREEYRVLVESMSEGLVVQNAAGTLIYVNQGLADMLGHAREEIMGQPALEFIADESRELWLERMARRREGDDAPYELALKGQGGRRIFVKVSPRPIIGANGAFSGSFAVVTDISERIRAEEVLRSSESELKLLSAQLLTAQEMERKRIASELHDGIGQSLSAVKFCVEEAVRLMPADAASAGIKALEGVVPRIQAAIEEVRRISMDLRPSTLDDLGILPTLAWFCREFQAIYHNIRIEKIITIQEQDISAPLKTVIYRIIQEAVSNAAKHAHANLIRIGLSREGNAVVLTVSDNGLGFDPEEAAARARCGRGYGLASMRERAEFSGGAFALSAAPGEGARLRVSWPCCGQHVLPAGGLCPPRQGAARMQ